MSLSFYYYQHITIRNDYPDKNDILKFFNIKNQITLATKVLLYNKQKFIIQALFLEVLLLSPLYL